MAVGKSYQGAWQAQSQQGAWQSAEVGGTVNLTGTSAITSAVDAALLVIWALAGTSAITSAVDGALILGDIELLTGTAAITSAADGALTLGITEALTGTAGVVAAVDGGLIVGWALTGTAPITSSVDADLTGRYHWLGMFYGYREYVGGWVGRIELPLWELEGRIPSWFEVYKGTAGDAWSAMIPFIDSRTGRSAQSIMLLIMAYGNEAEFRLSKDGIGYSDIVEVDPDMTLGGSFFRRYAGKGFSVRNKTPGKVAEYQLVPMW